MFNKVKPYMGEYMAYTKKAVVCIIIAVILSTLPYFFLYQLISPLILGEKLTIGTVLLYVALTVVCLVGNAVLYVQGLSYSHHSAYNTLKNIRISLQKKLEAQPLGNIRELGNGRIKKVFADDIDMIELLLAHAIPEGIGNLFIPVAVIISMLLVDWKLALLCIVALPLGMLAMGMMFKVGMTKMEAYYASGSRMNNTIIEYINGMEVVKVFNRDGESYERFESDIKSYRDLTLAWYKACWPWMALYSSIIPCLALFALPIGSWFVLQGISTLADLVLVICMSFAAGGPLLKAMTFVSKIPQLDYKIAELEKLIQDISLKQSDRNFEGNNRNIRFENVRFSYKDTEVIKGVNLELKEGQMTALVGESGSGKSTLAKLLVHFYDIDSGRVTLGGQDITDMKIEALNNEISYVSQEQFLFNTSLYENILIGKPDATREEVIEVAKKARCYDFIMALPEGFDTVIGEGGASLSGGEQQRISIARCILKNAPIVILDEATASVDADNESQIQAAISELVQGRTLLVIAHRLHTIANAEQILVISDGKIAESGNHETLFATKGIYHNMVTKRAAVQGFRN